MAKINDLTTSISELSNELALELILKIRQSRLAVKITKFTKKPKKEKKTKTKTNPLTALSKEELIKLLKESLL